MKQFLRIIFLFAILLTSENVSSQTPHYTLQAKNFIIVSPNRITFDIVITHTDAVYFEYAAGQYYFKVPQSIGALGIGTGVNSGFQYDSAGGQPISDFPMNLRPRNPSVASTSINGVPFYELRLAPNNSPGTGNGLILPQFVPKLVIRMKLIFADPFNLSNLNLLFRDSCTDNPVSLTRTKISVYIGIPSTQITRCSHHSIDLSGINLSPITCAIKLALEGFYDPVSDKLNRRETVTTYLRRTFSPYQIVDSAIAVIDSNNITGNFQFSTSAFSGTYYIVIKHRSSLETWSKTGGENLIRGINSYDFTSSASQAYGNNMVLKGSRYCFYSGNINGDMIIDAEDLLFIDNDLFNFVKGNAVTDLNGDNIVDIEDMSIADRNAENLVLVEWPGLTFDMRKNILKNKFNTGGVK